MAGSPRGAEALFGTGASCERHAVPLGVVHIGRSVCTPSLHFVCGLSLLTPVVNTFRRDAPEGEAAWENYENIAKEAMESMREMETVKYMPP